MGNYFTKKSNYDIKNAETNNFQNSDQIIRSNNSIDKCGLNNDLQINEIVKNDTKSIEQKSKEDTNLDSINLQEDSKPVDDDSKISETNKNIQNDSIEISKSKTKISQTTETIQSTPIPEESNSLKTPLNTIPFDQFKNFQTDEQQTKSSLMKDELTIESDHEFTFDDSEYINHDSDNQQETIDHASTAVHCSDFDDTQALMSEPTINLNFSENEELPKSDIEEVNSFDPSFIDPRSPSIDIIRTPLIPVGNMENGGDNKFGNLDEKVGSLKKDGTPKKMKNKCDELRKKVLRNKRKIQDIYDDSDKSNDENLPPIENKAQNGKGELSLLADQFNDLGINSPTSQKID